MDMWDPVAGALAAVILVALVSTTASMARSNHLLNCEMEALAAARTVWSRILAEGLNEIGAIETACIQSHDLAGYRIKVGAPATFPCSDQNRQLYGRKVQITVEGGAGARKQVSFFIP